MKKIFSTDRTLVVKGVAILLLLLHHISGAYFRQNAWIFKIGFVAKVCVCIFFILSGYGLAASYENKKNKGAGDRITFVLMHLKKVMLKFWTIYLIFLPINIFYAGRSLGEIYGPKRWDYMLIDFFGLNHIFKTPSMTGTWWYMGAMIVLYLLFPYLIYFMDKSKVKFFCVNLVIAICVGFAWHLSIQGTNPILFYLFPFSMGMILYQTDLLNRVLEMMKNSLFLLILDVILIVILGILRWKIGNEIDTLFGIAIILLIARVIPIKGILYRMLSMIGKYSGEIFMLHSFVYAWCFKKYVMIFHNIFTAIILTVIYSLIFAVVVEKIEKILKERIK
ncbi:MAG: acyltransferase [Anaerostipes sp.]|nr:acyltransferase [Anaerostipes sp.]